MRSSFFFWGGSVCGFAALGVSAGMALMVYGISAGMALMIMGFVLAGLAAMVFETSTKILLGRAYFAFWSRKACA